MEEEDVLFGGEGDVSVNLEEDDSGIEEDIEAEVEDALVEVESDVFF